MRPRPRLLSRRGDCASGADLGEEWMRCSASRCWRVVGRRSPRSSCRSHRPRDRDDGRSSPASSPAMSPTWPAVRRHRRRARGIARRRAARPPATARERQVPCGCVEPRPGAAHRQGALRRRHRRRRAWRGARGRRCRRLIGPPTATPCARAPASYPSAAGTRPRARTGRTAATTPAMRVAGARPAGLTVVARFRHHGAWRRRRISSGAPSPTTPRGCSTATASRWWADAGSCAQLARQQVPNLITPGRLPPGRRGITVVGPPRAGRRPVVLAAPRGGSRAGGTADLSLRLRLAAEALGPTFIKLGQIISSGEGLFPPELVDEFKRCRDQVPAESFDDVRHTVETDLGRPLEEVFDVVRRGAARRGVDRPGPRGPAAHRRGRRRQGATPRRRPPRPPRPAGDGVAGAAPRRAHPGRRPGQPAGARRAVRRHDRRGARLPRRGRQHARRRGDAPRARPDGLRRAASPSRAGHQAGARHAAPRRLQVRRRRRDARGRASTPRGWCARPWSP